MAVLNLDIAQRLDIICRKGDTFEFSFDIGQADLAEIGTWTMHVRPTEDDESSPPTLSASITSSGSVVSLNITSEVMQLVEGGLYVYDIQQYNPDDNSRKTYLYGTFQVNEDITI